MVRIRVLTEAEKARIWQNTYHTLLMSGFSEPEADWAAGNGFTLKEEVMKRIVARRKEDIKLYMRVFRYTRDEAIEKLSYEVRVRNEARDLAEEDYYNIMRVIYP